MTELGVPYGYIGPGGEVTCPVCGEKFAEQYDSTGEALTYNYASHYQGEHAS